MLALGEGRAPMLSSYPALSLDADHPLAALMQDSGHAPHVAVSFGTEAGLFRRQAFPRSSAGPATSPARTSPRNTSPRKNSSARTGCFWRWAALAA